MLYKKYWLAINCCYQIGPARMRRLASYFSLMEEAWYASNSDWQRAGLDEKTILSLRETREKTDPDLELKRLKKMGIRALTFKEKKFPKSLKNIDPKPAIIYLQGEIKEIDKTAVAVVGTRKMSLYGRQVTEKISSDLARFGATIVSGLARGVDTVAHESALANNGRTLAVVASGLDQDSIYPPENVNLLKRIIFGQGAVISEYPPHTPALRQHFPARNRLISALSLGVLVTECPVHSGALLTARAGLEQGKEIFAVPGDIRSLNSEGTNNLIKMGARAVSSASEILDELGLVVLEGQEAKKIIPETKDEAKILEFLSIKPSAFDLLVKKTTLN